MNNEPKTGIILTSRVHSSRLPMKALRRIGKKMLVEMTIENLLRQNKHEIVLAIPASSDCDVLEEVGHRYHLKIHRGQDESPLHRLHAAAVRFKYDSIVRITQDDPYIDAIQLTQMVSLHNRQRADYTYCSRIMEGAAGEVMSTKRLGEIVQEVGDKPVEFVSYYFKRGNLKTIDFLPPMEYQYTYRMTIDYEEDLQLANIVDGLLSKPYGVLDIINVLKPRPELRAINRMPEVTVYTCVHNQSRYVRECLESIKAQDFTDYELIIMDDCSPDSTASVVNEWVSQQSDSMRRKIRVERLSENVGLPAASNRAAHIAKGKFIVRVDADDMIDPSFLSLMRGALDQDRKLGCVFSAYRMVDEAGGFLEERSNRQLMDDKRHMGYQPGCCMLRTGALKNVLYFEELKHYEGLMFFKEFSKRYPFQVIDDVLWSYRQHPEQKSAEMTAERLADLQKVQA